MVGTLNLDRLIHGSARAPALTHAPGGLCYSLAAFSRLCPGRPLLPVAWLSREDAPVFAPCLDAPGMRREGLADIDGPGNRVTLDCRRTDKGEMAELRLPPLGRDQLEAARDCPWLLLNCSSGRDVAEGDWQAFRRDWRARHPRGWLQMDWHSLSLDWEEGRPRRPRRVPRAFGWLEDLDLLQLTLAETASLVGRPPRRLEEAADLLLRLRRAGCRRVVISDGPRGLLYGDGAGLRRQEAWPVAEVLDTTGCGDVLGAALLATLGQGWPAGPALATAARAAGMACGGLGPENLDLPPVGAQPDIAAAAAASPGARG